MRHVLVHDYLGIDLAEVWAGVERDLPALKKTNPAVGQAKAQARTERLRFLTGSSHFQS